MEWALRSGYREVEFKLDSEIVVNRANKTTKPTTKTVRNFKNPRKQLDHDRRIVMDGFQRIVWGLSCQFKTCLFTWIPREQNQMADMLSKATLKV